MIDEPVPYPVVIYVLRAWVVPADVTAGTYPGVGTVAVEGTVALPAILALLQADGGALEGHVIGELGGAGAVLSVLAVELDTWGGGRLGLGEGVRAKRGVELREAKESGRVKLGE